MRSTIQARWKLLAGGIAILALLLLVLRPGRAPQAPPDPAAPAPHVHGAGTGGDTAGAAGQPPALPRSTPSAPDRAGDGAQEDRSAAAAGAPRPPAQGEIVPRPARAETTDEDLRHTQQAALDLVERSIERLEAERVEAERSGDVETAQRNRIRIERLHTRRAEIQAELAGAEHAGTARDDRPGEP